MVFFSCKNLASLIQCQSSEKQTGHSILKELGGGREARLFNPYPLPPGLCSIPSLHVEASPDSSPQEGRKDTDTRACHSSLL